MEQSNTLGSITKSQEKRWLVENFASRAALLGFVYLCINIIYQQGYLSRLGFEFGLFSIARTLPLLFDNFLIAAYAFIAWGFIVEVTSSTYDQLFGFFNPMSWRDRNVATYRIIGFAVVVSYYIALHALFLAQSNWKLRFPTSLTSLWISLSKLLIPTWDFVFWWLSLLSVIALLVLFRGANRRYRTIRNMGLDQLLKRNRDWMFLQINLITPALAILAVFFFLVMIPGFVGSLMADLTIKNVHYEEYQQIDRIELYNVNSFCGEKINYVNDIAVWEKSGKDNFTIHMLGSIGEYDLFAKITDSPPQSKSGNTVFSYTPCLVSSDSSKLIVFHRHLSY